MFDTDVEAVQGKYVKFTPHDFRDRDALGGPTVRPSPGTQKKRSAGQDNRDLSEGKGAPVFKSSCKTLLDAQMNFTYKS